MRRLIALAIALAVASPMAAGPIAGGVHAASVATPLEDLSWLAGHWVGKTGRGEYIEEMWMPVRDGHMLGSFRWERGSGRWLFEFMSLEAAPAAGALTLRLKHFDRAFTGMEEKTASTTFTAIETSASRVLFELKEAGRVVRLTYARTTPDGLNVTYEETEPGKSPTRIEFPYTRAK